MTFARRARISFAASILLGLTWLFGIFAIGDLRLTFQWLFCITNSTQGLFLFIFHTVRNPDIQKIVRKRFTFLNKKTSREANKIIKSESTITGNMLRAT